MSRLVATGYFLIHLWRFRAIAAANVLKHQLTINEAPVFAAKDGVQNTHGKNAIADVRLQEWLQDAKAPSDTAGRAWRQLPTSTKYMQAGGWVWRGIVPWCKPDARQQLGRFAAQCEYFIWGTAGAVCADDTAGRIPSFFECIAPRNRVHVTQKPVELLRELLRVVPVGGCVLDPFMSSGSCGVAALQTGPRFVGIELDPVHFDKACERINDAYRQGLLFDHTGEAQEQTRLLL